MSFKSRGTIFRFLALLVCIWFGGFVLFFPAPFTARAKSVDDARFSPALPVPLFDKYLVVEMYSGRLNNQLWTLDWAFRCSKSFNRTLIVPSPLTSEQWIGMPETAEEEHHSVWDMEYLRTKFAFISEKQAKLDSSIPQEVFLPYSELDPHCVWDDRKGGEDGIYVGEWLSRAPAECLVVFFVASHGLVHPFRGNTQTLGVDQFAFWSALRPATYLQDAVATFFSRAASGSLTSVSVHSRAHNSYNEPHPPGEPHPTCDRLARMILSKAIAHLEQAQQCCQVSRSAVWGAFKYMAPSSFLSELSEVGMVSEQLQSYFETHLAGMCHLTKDYLFAEIDFQQKDSSRKPDREVVIKVSDHEWEDVEGIFVQFGAKEMNFTAFQTPLGGSRSHLVEDPTKRRWHSNIEQSILDLLILSRADIMLGAPSSTFSKTACMWRGRERLTTTNFCFLVLMEAGSDSCQSIDCRAFK